MIDFKEDPKYDKWDDKLQSPVVSYNLSKPMTMIGFMSLPEHAQKEYLQLLRKDYGGRIENIADMFGCERETVAQLYKKYDVSLNVGRFGAPQRAAWAKFIEGYEMPPMEAPEEKVPAETPQNAPETPKPEDVPQPPPTPKAKQTPKAKPKPTITASVPVLSALRAFRVDLAGPLDGVLEKLKTFLDLVGDLPVRITISVDEEDN